VRLPADALVEVFCSGFALFHLHTLIVCTGCFGLDEKKTTRREPGRLKDVFYDGNESSPYLKGVGFG
jgi:hypothetical protein